MIFCTIVLKINDKYFKRVGIYNTKTSTIYTFAYNYYSAKFVFIFRLTLYIIEGLLHILEVSRNVSLTLCSWYRKNLLNGCCYIIIAIYNIVVHIIKLLYKNTFVAVHSIKWYLIFEVSCLFPRYLIYEILITVLTLVVHIM